jgi:Fe-S-cluster containining protein
VKLTALEAIYAGLPSANCQGKCQESCGPVPMSEAEWGRIAARLGAKAPAATLFTPGAVMPEIGADLTCPLLDRDTGRCTVYALRPLLCRLWGTAQGMPCEFGCTPDRVVPDDEAHDLLRRVMEVAA